MTEPISSLTRRRLLATSMAFSAASAATGAFAMLRPPPATGPDDTSVRPFRVAVDREALVDLRRRLAATRWPSAETVADTSQGVRLATLRSLVRYWATDYDWRKGEARLNAVPQFVTTIDGLDIQFAHIRSRHADAMPLIMTHGWPGSIFELLKVVGPLTDPTAHGGRAEDAFHLVLPSLPGFGFSGQPEATGLSLIHI